MKLPKEQVFVIIIGLFLLSYLLEAVVPELTIKLTTPYAYLSPLYFSKYPFTTATVLIRALSLYLAPIFLISFIPKSYFAKVGIYLLVGVLAQLYALQEVATGTTLIPLEWSLSLAISGAMLLIPVVSNLLKGIFFSTKSKLTGAKETENTTVSPNENN